MLNVPVTAAPESARSPGAGVSVATALLPDGMRWSEPPPVTVALLVSVIVMRRLVELHAIVALYVRTVALVLVMFVRPRSTLPTAKLVHPLMAVTSSVLRPPAGVKIRTVPLVLLDVLVSGQAEQIDCGCSALA